MQKVEMSDILTSTKKNPGPAAGAVRKFDSFGTFSETENKHKKREGKNMDKTFERLWLTLDCYYHFEMLNDGISKEDLKKLSATDPETIYNVLLDIIDNYE